jgi:hypothetical protein
MANVDANVYESIIRITARILFISDIRDGLNIKTKLSSITRWHSILTEMHPRFIAALCI